MTKKALWIAGGLALLVAVPSALAAQDEPAPQPEPAETELVFDREVFQYPSFTRRNPFRPLLAADSGGPRFEELTLIGIVFSDDPSASVAVVSTGGVTMNEDGTMAGVEGTAYNLKVGDVLGNVTVREIHRDRIEVTVSEFDDQLARTMVFVSRRQGGSQ